jgi:hypothetical protein
MQSRHVHYHSQSNRDSEVAKRCLERIAEPKESFAMHLNDYIEYY